MPQRWNLRTSVYQWFAFVIVFCAVQSIAIGNEPTTLRVLSYNIHHGEGNDGRFDLDRLAKIIQDSGADLVSLQEVDMRTARSGGVHQLDSLRQAANFPFAYFGKAIDFQQGEYGNAVLSKWPATAVCNVQLPQVQPSERRAALFVEFSFFETPIWFVATHLDAFNQANRTEQAAAIVRQCQFRPNVVLAGDLNSVRSSAPMQLFQQTLTLCGEERATSPAHKPVRQIDYVAYRSRHLNVVNVEVLDQPVASDHLPLLVTLQWHSTGQ
ncbi:MAG: endonuclease/exonuclease/phosphatase family protein [Planctomycetales bacterium]|nr:endonuclease/exonuclease/phosphatase family protein [Planctomycetales bacterium]